MYKASWSARTKRAAGPFVLALLWLSTHGNAEDQTLGRLKELEKELVEQSSVGTPGAVPGNQTSPKAPDWAQRQDLRPFLDDPVLAGARPPLHPGCDLWSGRWLYDPSYPLWPQGSCPLGNDEMDCVGHQINNTDFSHFRWQPDACTLPPFNATAAREALRGKRVVFLGDSLGRNQRQSLICLLSLGLPDPKNSVEEVTEPSLDEQRANFDNFRTRVAYFRGFNLTVEFRFSPALVKRGMMKFSGLSKDRENKLFVDTAAMDMVTSGLVNESLRLGLPTDNNTILVLNTGHWWGHDCIFLLLPGDPKSKPMSVEEGFEVSMHTVARWLQNLKRQTGAHIFWRSYSPGHYIGGAWNTGGRCPTKLPVPGRTSPLVQGAKVFGPVASRVVRDAGFDILDISALSDKRPDAHPEYSHNRRNKLEIDCNHWCLPGVPDIWNVLFLAQITELKPLTTSME